MVEGVAIYVVGKSNTVKFDDPPAAFVPYDEGSRTLAQHEVASIAGMLVEAASAAESGNRSRCRQLARLVESQAAAWACRLEEEGLL